MEFYVNSLPNSWFHLYLMGNYYNRSGGEFIMVPIDDQLESNIEKKRAYHEDKVAYKNLYNEGDKSKLWKFVHEFISKNKTTLFYHLYWMGYVCDSNGVPIYMKDKRNFAYSRKYQKHNKKNKKSFETYMKKQDEEKEKRYKNRLKKEKTKNEKTKKMNTLIQKSDANANYIGGRPTRKQPVAQRTDANANYIGGRPTRKQPSHHKPLIQPLNESAHHEKNPDAFLNPSTNLSTKLSKTRRYKKRKNLKSEMRRLKLQMANLL